MNGAAVKAYSLTKDGTKKLSENFKVKEFACRDGSDVVFVSDKLVSVLQQIRSHFNARVIITSAYRTPVYNKKMGGATHSQHLYGKAADFTVEGIAPKEVARYAETLLLNTGGIGIYSSFVHIDDRAAKSRWTG